MNILITGDFFISDEFREKKLIEQPVFDLFQKADYRIVNLETAITIDNPQNKIIKTGPHLRTSKETITPYLRQLKVDAVTLANNHILDYNVQGLFDTFDALNECKIGFVGAGNSLAEANRPLTIEKEGLKVAILSFCENEWSIAEEGRPGANPLDIIDNINQIKAARTTHDKVICIIHGGNEYYHLPSLRMVKQYRFYADNGADAIIAHHSHCIGGYEVYNHTPIIYSLGNFIFTRKSNKACWYIGLVANLSIDKQINFELIPTKQNLRDYQVSVIEGKAKFEIFDSINKFNSIIATPSKLKENWDEFIKSRSKGYLYYISPVNSFSNKYLRALLSKISIIIFLKQRYLKYLLNLMRCEAHSEVTKAVISKFLKNKM